MARPHVQAGHRPDQAACLGLQLLPHAGCPNVRHQEESVTTDSDGDGVVDFDETERFGTNPSSDDGDQDLLRDKQDIITGVFDPSTAMPRPREAFGRDYDSDEIPTERDKDSDEGGCPDGVEDMNGNGHRDQRSGTTSMATTIGGRSARATYVTAPRHVHRPQRR